MPSKKTHRYNCAECGKECWIAPCNLKWGYGKFCSRSCQSAVTGRKMAGRNLSAYWAKGEANPQWKGGAAGKRQYRLARDASLPHVTKAHSAVQIAIRAGRLVREPCVFCGKPGAEAHHEDYSKPLDVWWLCRLHHERRHQVLDEIGWRP